MPDETPPPSAPEAAEKKPFLGMLNPRLFLVRLHEHGPWHFRHGEPTEVPAEHAAAVQEPTSLLAGEEAVPLVVPYKAPES